MSDNHKNTLKTAWNDVTGDSIKTGKGSQEKYTQGWDTIFGKKKEGPVVKTCIKCPRDVNVYCDYCGIRQCDGDEAGWSLNRIRL